MSLVFGSVCSGIGAPEMAWRDLGWRCAFMSEIEAFPRAVLSHHYPEVPLHGDFTTIQAGQYAPIDVLVGHAGSHPNGGGQVAVAFAQNQRDEVRLMDVAGALAAEPGAKQQTYAKQGAAVRRLTPRECERLQGFPDDHTLIPYRNGMAADGPRYRALGNSMAVPVVRWIGRRIMAACGGRR